MWINYNVVLGWNFAGYVGSEDSWEQHSGDGVRAAAARSPEYGPHQAGSHMNEFRYIDIVYEGKE